MQQELILVQIRIVKMLQLGVDHQEDSISNENVNLFNEL
jgi:hypothetical protein